MSNETSTDATNLYAATLLSSTRITPADSPEEVRNLVFRTNDLGFDAKTGQCIRVMAPGQFGNPYHTRLYSLADYNQSAEDSTEFTLCVRRCFYIDDFSGEEYQGVASNYLCNLKPGQNISFAGPLGQPFPIPADKSADILMIGMGTGIAPFRGLAKEIYEHVGGWQGKVRLYYGARSGLEMLYMNEENKDMAHYFDEKTFKAFQAISPRPHFNVPVALDKALEQNAAEVLEMVKKPNTQVFVAGAEAMLGMIDKTMAGITGSPDAWQQSKSALVASGRWNEVLY